MEHIGRTIKALRKKAGLTQERLADCLGVSAQAVSKWEVGSTSPDLSLIAPLCRVLGCSADELLGIGGRQKEELIKSAREALREGRSGDAVSLFRRALAIAPKDFRPIVELCAAMRNGDSSPDTLREVVRLLENAVGSCEDENLNARLRTALSLALNGLGEREAAIRAAGYARETLPACGNQPRAGAGRFRSGSDLCRSRPTVQSAGTARGRHAVFR